MKKDAFYFPHDSNAKDDPKCILLIEQLGLEGYGIYWVLIETLRDQPGYCYPIQLLPAIARRFNTTFEKVKTVIYNYNLFTVKDDILFYSQSLIERMKAMDISREKQRQKALKRWGKDAAALPEHSHGNAELIPIEEKRREEKRVEEIKVEDKPKIIGETPTSSHLIIDDKINILHKRFENAIGKEIIKLYPKPTDEELKELERFISYWIEPNKSRTRMRYELEKTWDTALRIKTWFNRSKSFSKPETSTRFGYNNVDTDNVLKNIK